MPELHDPGILQSDVGSVFAGDRLRKSMGATDEEIPPPTEQFFRVANKFGLGSDRDFKLLHLIQVNFPNVTDQEMAALFRTYRGAGLPIGQQQFDEQQQRRINREIERSLDRRPQSPVAPPFGDEGLFGSGF